jgi:single-strand DNA-binding protein
MAYSVSFTFAPLKLFIKLQIMKTNNVLLIGYVGSHLSSSDLGNGRKRVAIRMATHYKYKSKDGIVACHTVWHDVIAWNKKAEYAERSFVKGSKILVEGRIDYHRFQGKKGYTIYKTYIQASSLSNLDR